MIDADAMIAEIEDYIDEYSEVDNNGLHNGKWCAMCEAKMLLENTPTIDAIPVEWIQTMRDCYMRSYHAGHKNDLHAVAVLNDMLIAWHKEQETNYERENHA